MISAATRPETAAGTTTMTVVDILRAPKPSDASRRAFGTERRASSEIEATRGMVRIPTPRPAARRLNCGESVKTFCTKSGEITVRAKKPSTMLGIPARISRIGFSKRRTRGLAYSER